MNSDTKTQNSKKKAVAATKKRATKKVAAKKASKRAVKASTTKKSVKKSSSSVKKAIGRKVSVTSKGGGAADVGNGLTRARLHNVFISDIAPALKKEFGYSTTMQVPRIQKVVLNMGVGEAVNDKKVLENALSDLTKISGQKPLVTRARRSVAGFKIREGYPIGCMVTLRGQRMFEFLDRLISIAIPRVRDFRGISNKSFDGRGNFNMGVKEQIIFPEIEYDKIDAIRGLNITIATSARTDKEARSLLTGFNFPLRS